MRILVTGAGGMLGSALVPYLHQAGHCVTATDIRGDLLEGAFYKSGLDVRVPWVIEDYIGRHRPELVCHLAALTSLEECEADPDAAYHTNTIGTKNVALACRKARIPMAYIGTAGIFDGFKREPYHEFDQPNPCNVYGETKLQGEYVVIETLPEHYICRAGWMMSGGPGRDKKFVGLIMAQLGVIGGCVVIEAVDDKIGSLTYGPDFARCFEQVVTSGRYGTYHMVSGGSASRFEIAQEIVRLRTPQDCAVVMPVSSDLFKDEFSAPRPRSEAMRNLVLDLEGRNTMRPWQVALAEYLELWR